MEMEEGPNDRCLTVFSTRIPLPRSLRMESLCKVNKAMISPNTATTQWSNLVWAAIFGILLVTSFQVVDAG